MNFLNIMESTKFKQNRDIFAKVWDDIENNRVDLVNSFLEHYMEYPIHIEEILRKTFQLKTPNYSLKILEKCKIHRQDLGKLLHFSIPYHDIVTIKMIEIGSDVNQLINEDRSPMIIAIQCRKINIIQKLLDHGAHLFYYRNIYEIDVIFEAMLLNCDPDIIEWLWKDFHKNMLPQYKKRYTKPILYKLCLNNNYCIETEHWQKYFDIITSNKEQLHEELSHLTQHPLAVLAQTCYKRSYTDEQTFKNVKKLLDSGVILYNIEIDTMYVNNHRNLIDKLLNLNIHINCKEHDYITFSYFHFTLLPELDKYMSNALLYLKNSANTQMGKYYSIIELIPYFSFTNDIKNKLVGIRKELEGPLEKVVNIPSLAELSREKSRKYLCDFYNLKNVRELIYVLKKIELSGQFVDIILYKRPIYYY